MGHQRAIAIGLSVQNHAPCDTFVVMDGDGEDKPEQVPELLEALKESAANSAPVVDWPNDPVRQL